jgi:hypothetical protein
MENDKIYYEIKVYNYNYIFDQNLNSITPLNDKDIKRITFKYIASLDNDINFSVIDLLKYYNLPYIKNAYIITLFFKQIFKMKLLDENTDNLINIKFKI